ncbi:MAG: glycosyltransferase family 4 protein [Kiritimatiellae bacterium]|nr:glycosyltransferase family 4 protein [Kiritimatiellia bacterium]
MPKIRVLQMLEATTGGTRRHLNDLVTHLNRERFRVSVLCSTLRDRSFLRDVQSMQRAGVHVTVVPMVRHISPIRDLFCLLAIFRHLRLYEYDIVHTHSSKAGFIGRLAARLAHVPCIIHTPHVFPFEMKVRETSRKLFFQLEQFIGRYTDAIICVCSSQIDAARSLSLDPRVTVALVENGVTEEAFQVESTDAIATCRHQWGFDHDEIIIGHVGRFTRQKGQDVLVGALKRVTAEVPRARLLMVGDGPDRIAVERKIRRLGLQKHCFILEPREDLKLFYSTIDIFALPSLWEGLPYALLEAMAAQRPVVATRTGGIPDVVKHGFNGLLIPCGDEGSLARCLVRMANDRDLRNSCGLEARNTVASRFQLRDMIAKIEDVYLTTLDRVKRKG